MMKMLRKDSSLFIKNFNLIKKYGWTLIGIPDKPNNLMFDKEYFCIHEDLFDRIQSTHQDKNISLDITSIVFVMQ